jgi:hypothetical protein
MHPAALSQAPLLEALAVLALILAAACAAPARAGVLAGTPQVSFGLLAGTAQPVASLADYQWDVRPHVAWGAQAMAGVGPFSAGLRFWSSSTTQSLALSGQDDPAVRSQSLELVARARVASWHRVSLHAMAAGGRLALRWDPDHVTVDTGGTPVEVELAPIHEWVGGAGLAFEASLPAGITGGLEGERRVFALDTAHRSGSGVVYERGTFGEWAARCTLRRTWDL